MHRTAIIGLSTLESIGIIEILKSIGEEKIKIFNDFKNFHELHDTMDIMIVSSDIFSLNHDYFLPRKNRYLIVSSMFSDSRYVICRNEEVESIRGKLAFLYNEAPISTYSNSLSQREMEVLKGLVLGKTIKEIGEDLFISPNTVVTHRKNISSKLGIKSISGLSVYALMNGII